MKKIIAAVCLMSFPAYMFAQNGQTSSDGSPVIGASHQTPTSIIISQDTENMGNGSPIGIDPNLKSNAVIHSNLKEDGPQLNGSPMILQNGNLPKVKPATTSKQNKEVYVRDPNAQPIPLPKEKYVRDPNAQPIPLPQEKYVRKEVPGYQASPIVKEPAPVVMPNIQVNHPSVAGTTPAPAQVNKPSTGNADKSIQQPGTPKANASKVNATSPEELNRQQSKPAVTTPASAQPVIMTEADRPVMATPVSTTPATKALTEADRNSKR